jgi:FMN phosphatase YigB (HAD superfamily)
VYRAILLDLYGTLVHDDDEPVASICALVGDRAGVDAAAVDQEWYARICQAADAAHGPAFRTLADLNLSSLTETAAYFGITLDAEDVCREQMRFWRRPPLYADSSAFLQAVELPVCLVSDVDRDDLHRQHVDRTPPPVAPGVMRRTSTVLARAGRTWQRHSHDRDHRPRR